MEAAKVQLFLCLLLLLFMPIFFAPSCGNKEVCEEWTSDMYRMLFLCRSTRCNQYCVSEGATRGRCGFSSDPSATALKNATECLNFVQACNGN
ncbi:hypothetical protein OsJ_30157 [Oryza sativa Japonica Group]|uniref:Uncharacterized protein n=1 Tax=Oryza sativa subsp. japonica TaxID=39947 RepID=Q69JX0_ORYSJ|nr:hypothetical protein OsJ_30157 [Oryza sativa Japonica Group]KAF2917268.1 hypothetical protein DAI22_09g179700 [Oryza sativa Japonica Group]BAD34242.1 hypothetical protein [Oryza sativa Japonica Group]BAD34379.1 hypothetical protein [Oryza sativa Japonica Group]